jgi:endonuclease/exonuclease/phosphatase family metal-dependent hydrolase
MGTLKRFLMQAAARWLGAIALCAASIAPAVAEERAPLSLKVLTLNIWYGGEQVNFPTVVAAIRIADADIVGLQEPDGNLSRIAQAAGYAHVDPRRNLMSRYPLFDPGVGERTQAGAAPYGITGLDESATHAFVMVRPGEVVAAANTHLSSDPYGPEAVRDGAELEEVLALETRVRAREAAPLLSLGRLAGSGVPVFLTGDFNTPSHLDWTEAMRARRPEAVRYAVAWPVPKMLAEAGVRDSYREAHPDPVAKPGLTWTAGMPHPFVRPGETLDRIDYVFVAGPARTVSSQILGEPGGPDVDLAISPYPSDHRGVLSTFEVTPAPAPVLISVSPARAARGDDVLVRGFEPGEEGWTAAIVARGAPASQAKILLREPVAAWRRAGRFNSAELSPGAYEAVLIGADGAELKRTAFSVVDPAAPVRLSAPDTVKSGGVLRASFENAPGHRHDWIGVFHAGDPDVGAYLAHAYTDARVAGAAEIALADDEGPLAPGDYEARLLRDDSPTILARAPFRIIR